MLLLNSLVSATTGLLALSAQFASVYGSALPEEHRRMLDRRDFYDRASNSILEFHKKSLRKYDEEMIEERRKNKEKRIAWEPARTFSSGSMGHHAMYAGTGCWTGSRRQWFGILVRTITFPVEAVGRQYMWWLNRTFYEVDLPSGSPNECYGYGKPTYNYHLSSGSSQICTDKIWNPTSKTWSLRSSSNANTGWTTNNATYGNQKVRTIFDCHLDRVAVEYANNHPDLGGYKPVRYENDGFRFFRFYDANNFAWFLMCPSNWPAKRSVDETGLAKRQVVLYNGNNPIWDFMAEKYHHYAADNTPLYDYAGGIDDYADEEDISGFAYSNTKIYTINYWPPGNWRNITVEGRKCTQLAVSRPGLRHWTVRFFDNPAYGWPQKTDEWNYPADWNPADIFDESASKSSNAP
ncbi:hypothetical protein ABW19_dt0202192 [Dactylella cylindrospora]|nr:hypothetical protein ABW19_dt0202192 [Dactylella cylindrospora]